MAIRIQGTVVVDDARAISNVTNVSATDATFSGTSAVKIPSGTTAQQPGTPVVGMLRFNTSKNQVEVYNQNLVWTSVGSQVVTGGAYFISANQFSQ